MTQPTTEFRDWLVAQDYAKQTAYIYDRAVRRVLQLDIPGSETWLLPSSDTDFAALRRYATYLEKHDARPGKTELLAAVRALAEREPATQVSRRREAQARDRKTSVSIQDDEWSAFCGSLDGLESREALALDVLATTGQRVGDLLAVERSALELAQKSGRLRVTVKGGKFRILPWNEAWANLWERWRADEKRAKVEPGWWPTLGDWLVCRSVKRSKREQGGRDHAGYKRMQRALASAAVASGVSGRIHLHRLRRTVAVQAARVTKDLTLVQQLLGHSSMQTTARYLDEARPDELAELQGQVSARFRKTTPVPTPPEKP